MRLFLQLTIADWKETPYTKPMMGYASSLADDIVGSDLDNQSESYVVELVSKLTQQAEQIFVLITVGSEELPLGSILTLLNQLLKSKDKVKAIVITGNHAMVEKMIKPFQEKCFKENDEEIIKEKIKAFAKGLAQS